MPPDRPAPVLTEFELLVVLAVLSLGDSAYPLAIADAIQRRTGRKASRGAVLITLERLEDHGLLTSFYGEPTRVRGGRAKRFFRPKPAAVKAVRDSLGRIETMTAGLEARLKLR
jgi:PadR family transcriptional regulator, regulatory protein PadR